jgi:hypothetical protein
MTFDFTLILSCGDIDLDAADRLYGQCDDATLASSDGAHRLHFDREAPSLEAAIRSAIADVKIAGFEVKRIELEPASLAQPA